MMMMMAGGALGGAVLSSALAPKPAAPQLTPPPQPSVAPDVAGTRASLAGMGQGGGSPGIAQTFLSGMQGIDPSLLQLGKATLLGGGS